LQSGPGIDRLPDPQRDAVRVAFGLSSGPRPDPFLVGLAVLNRLADLAEHQPVLCVVDDAQWLDNASARTLAFVARRLQAEAVALVFAVREPLEQLIGLPELVLSGLAPEDARELLRSALSMPLDESVRDRFIAETRGNPLALQELPRGLSATQLAGGFGLIGTEGVSSRVEDSFRHRVEELPAETRLLMVIAAAEPVGDPVLLWRAATTLGISPRAAEPAEAAGLLDIGVRVVFRHPLVRSAVYRMAAPGDRRQVHRALADATDAEMESDRRVWHLALAASGDDEGVADELERSADRAEARGGLAAAAAFLENAVRLTPDPGQRGRRAVAAARAKLSAGAPHDASELLSIADASPLDERHRAQVDLLRAQAAFAVKRGSDAAPLLLAAAKRLEPLDVRAARDTYLEALFAALVAGRLGPEGAVREVARAARGAPPTVQPPTAADLLLDGYAQALTEGHAAGVPMLQKAVRAFRSADAAHTDLLRWAFLACHAALALWDDESYRALSIRQIELARATGALSVLPMSLTFRIRAHGHAGELDAAASMMLELEAVTNATGIKRPPYAAIALAAWRGREAEARRLMDESIEAVSVTGEGNGLTFIEGNSAVLCNALGRYDEALAWARLAGERREELQSPIWIRELIEAAVRSGNAREAVDPLAELSQMTVVTRTDWALGIEARSRALLSAGEAAEALYVQAIEHHARGEARVDLARAHLVYGEWLRREGRRVHARDELRIAHQMFASFGTEAFASRAARELAATGERVRRLTPETVDELTPQEAQIAKLAAEGDSNREIGAQLFISHRTVGYHLGKVFAKLGVNNRAQLHAALDSRPSGG
jgi:DNA-binding CsgD family transcriptional regulator